MNVSATTSGGSDGDLSRDGSQHRTARNTSHARAVAPRRADLGLLLRVDRVAVLRRGEATGTHVGGVVPQCSRDLEIEIRVPANELRTDVADEVAEDVVRDDELP